MKYLNARVVLPDTLVNELQEYIQGEYIYIPVREGYRKNWGEVSGCRREIEQRNKDIIEKHKKGVSMEALADLYCLSIYTVRKIIYEK